MLQFGEKFDFVGKLSDEIEGEIERSGEFRRTYDLRRKDSQSVVADEEIFEIPQIS
jgi:hypothetical protein